MDQISWNGDRPPLSFDHWNPKWVPPNWIMLCKETERSSPYVTYVPVAKWDGDRIHLVGNLDRESMCNVAEAYMAKHTTCEQRYECFFESTHTDGISSISATSWHSNRT